MVISARNVFKGTVVSVKEGPINAEVEVSTAAGDTIIATVTEASLQSLELAAGKEVVVVVKAPWVTLLSGTPEYRFSARNQLSGTVGSLVPGAVNSLVNVLLASGATISAIVTNDAVGDMGLAEGTPVVALFKAGHVLLGVPA